MFSKEEVEMAIFSWPNHGLELKSQLAKTIVSGLKR